MSSRPTLWNALLLLFGVFCGSTAVIMVKAGTEHPFLVSSYRLLIAAAVLSPLFFRDLAAAKGSYGWKQFGWSVVPAVILGLHFMGWIAGARMTSVANASLIGNLTPVAMPFFLWAVYRERVTRMEVVGTLFTLVGLALLAGSNLRVSATGFTGDMICFVAMLGFAAYLALGRRNSGRISLWLYMVPLYAVAGLLCLLISLFFLNPIKPYTSTNALLILGLGLIPTVFGHTILNYSMKHFRGQVVSVTNLGQPVFAVALGYLFFREVPTWVDLAAAALIIAGALVVLRSGWEKR